MSKADIIARIKTTLIDGTAHERRQAFEKLAGHAPIGELATINGINTRFFGSGNNVVWLHGGGYVFGSPVTHGPCAAYLASRTGMRVWVPEYRLAPEHPWPAPLNDVLQFIEALEGQLSLVGDSAGGHLAINVARRVKGRVNSLALISPNTDRTGRSQTRASNSDIDLMNDDSTDKKLAKLAFADLRPEHPDVSPLLAQLDGLPPTYLTASTHEVLLDDTLLFARALAHARVSHITHIASGLFHMWTLWPDELPEARQTLDRIATFICEVTDEMMPYSS